MRRFFGRFALAGCCLVLVAAICDAQDGAGGKADRTAARGDTAARPAPTPEQIAEHKKRMKTTAERMITMASTRVQALQPRHDELSAMLGQDTIAVDPPSAGMFGAQAMRGGRGGGRYRGRTGGRRGAAETTFDVPNTEEMKTAAKAAVDAYFGLLSGLDEQKKAMEANLEKLSAGGEETAEGGGLRNLWASLRTGGLRQKIQEAEAVVNKAEADLTPLLAKAWLDAAAQKITSEEGKAAVAAAQTALANYLALKPQLAALEEKIDKEVTTLDEGLKKALEELTPKRQPREGRTPRGERGQGAEKPKEGGATR